MRKSITIAILGISTLAATGCANGPIRKFFHGAACNSCQPAMGNTVWGQDESPCADGQCPSPVLPGPAGEIAPGESGIIYGQGYDPFSGSQIVTPPDNTGVLPRPR